MAIQGLLENIDKDLEELNMLNALDIVEAAEQNKQTMFNIIHKHIIKVIPDRIQLGKSKRKRKRKTNKENGILLSVYTIHSDVPVQYVYVPRKYNNEVLFKWNGEEWCPEHIDIKEMEKE